MGDDEVYQQEGGDYLAALPTGLAAPAARQGAGGRRRSAVSSEAMPKSMDELQLPVSGKKTQDEIELIEEAMLRNILFESCDIDQRTILRGAMEEKYFEEGDVIIRQGDDGDYYYVIDRGSVDIFITADSSLPARGAKPIVTFKTGASFGELALMYNQPRAATVIAAERTRTWALSRKHYRGIIMFDNFSRKKKYEELVQTVPLLENMTHAERVALADVFTSVCFQEGDVVIEQGEPGDFFYIIEQGECDVYKADSPGDDRGAHVATLRENEYFGELALLTNEPRAASVYAATNRVKCVRVDRDAFTRMMGPCEDLMRRHAEGY